MILDIKNAYDTIWQDGMLYKLFKWLIKSFYKDFKCQVKFGTLSELLSALQGIHQGTPHSTLLFVLFENELLQLVKHPREHPKLLHLSQIRTLFLNSGGGGKQARITFHFVSISPLSVQLYHRYLLTVYFPLYTEHYICFPCWKMNCLCMNHQYMLNSWW